MRGTFLGALLSTLLVTRIFSDTCTWNNCNGWSYDQTVINVHVVPHTHDDMGWKKTADDYYTGAHPSGTEGVIYPGVQYVINTVLNELSKDPKRRFSYCETGYLTRWLEDTLRNPKQVQKLKNFVTNGQLELIGGGWVQPDEATSHYTDLIDQYTLGLTKLQETFNSSCAKPKVSWQIDPFGHSREHGNLAAMMGYEGLFFAREHYLEHTYRVHNKTLEFQWKVSEDLDNTITTGAFYNMYYPPEQFNWDVVSIATNPIIDDKKLKGYNLDWYLWDPIIGFVPYILFQRLPSQAHNHVLLLMGSDFLFSNANMWFTNMDKLIQHVNAQSPGKIKMFYSTPACYLKAVNEWFSRNGTTMTSKKGQDFFPYAYNNNFLGGAHSYWSGFYTSKPAFKGLVRESSALLQLIRKINAISLDENVIDQNLKIQKLERAVALSQHHDAITGTSKDAVTKDYIRRLLRGWDAGETSLNNALTLLSPSGKNMQNLKICRKMNETDCYDELMGNIKKIAITVFNGHIQPVESLIRLPYYNFVISNDLTAVSLYDSNGNAVYNKVFSTFNNADFFTQNPQLNNSNSASYEIYFKANVGALGYNTYFLDLSTPVNPPTIAAPSTTKISHALQDDTSETTIQNDHIRLYFDKNGKLYQYEDLNVHMNYSFQQDFLFYEGYGFILPVTNEQQSSGAYVFRPANNTPQSIAGSKIYIQVIRSKDVQEVRQVFSNWASQSIRLIQGKPYAEFEWTVGPVPTGSSKEVITRYTSSNLNNNGVFQTDSNGRQMIMRKLNYNDDYTYEPTEPVASNYYPVNTRILINDPSKNLSFAVLTDRSQGGASLNNGEIELMLHRRDFFDDGYGVNEALNELGTDGRGLVVRGKHWVFFGSSDTAVLQHRTLAMEMYNTPFVGLSQYDSIDDYTKNYATSLTGISVAQNLSVNLLTLKQLDPETILLRLEHVFQKNENSMYSNQPVIVDLSTLFPKLTVNKVQEMNLVATEAVNSTVSNMIVTLTPMQIKTFLLNVSKKN